MGYSDSQERASTNYPLLFPVPLSVPPSKSHSGRRIPRTPNPSSTTVVLICFLVAIADIRFSIQPGWRWFFPPLTITCPPFSFPTNPIFPARNSKSFLSIFLRSPVGFSHFSRPSSNPSLIESRQTRVAPHGILNVLPYPPRPPC